jgi:hypothetical protein
VLYAQAGNMLKNAEPKQKVPFMDEHELKRQNVALPQVQVT